MHEGLLRIDGVRWSLGGEVACRHRFALKGRRLNDTPQHRAMGTRARDRRLEARVTATVPWLGVEVTGLKPAQLFFSGEVRQGWLVLTNVSQMPITTAAVKVDSSRDAHVLIGDTPQAYVAASCVVPSGSAGVYVCTEQLTPYLLPLQVRAR